jgi:general secretion pathway protein G
VVGFFPAPAFLRQSSAERRATSGVRPADHSAAFTLVELAVVLLVVGTLIGAALPSYTRALNNARVARAIGDIRAIEKDIAAYEVTNGGPPPTLAEVGRAGLLDPWGRAYQFLNFEGLGPSSGMRKDKFLVPLNSTYDLYSRGKDGQSKPALTAAVSRDDIVRANDGGFVGLAVNY